MIRWQFHAMSSLWETVRSQGDYSMIHTASSTAPTNSYPLMFTFPDAHPGQRPSSTALSCSRRRFEIPRCTLRDEPSPAEGRESHWDIEGELPQRHQRCENCPSLASRRDCCTREN